MNGGSNGGTICQRRPYNRVDYGIWFTILVIAGQKAVPNWLSFFEKTPGSPGSKIGKKSNFYFSKFEFLKCFYFTVNAKYCS